MDGTATGLERDPRTAVDLLCQMCIRDRAVGETADAFLDQIDRLGASLEEANAAINDAVDRLYPCLLYTSRCV